MLPSLEVRIGLDGEPFVAGTREVAEALAGMQRGMDAAAAHFRALGDSLTAVGKRMSVVSAGVAGAGAAMFGLARSAAGAGDAVAKASARAGVGIERWQELTFAIGQLTGMTTEQAGKALEVLNRRIGEAARGSAEAVAAFAAVGISAEEIAAGTVTADEAFERIDAALNDVPTAAEAAALASKLLGEEAGRLGPALRNTTTEVDDLAAKARDLGIIIGEDAARAGEAFGDKMGELTRQLAMLKNEVGNELVPVFVDVLIPAMQEHVIPALREVAGYVADAITWFANLSPEVQAAAGVIAAALGAAGPVLLALGVASKAFAAILGTGPIGAFIAAAALATAAWARWGDDLKAGVGAALQWLGEKFEWVMGKIDALIALATAAATAIASVFASPQIQTDFRGAVGVPAAPLGGTGAPMSGIGGGGDIRDLENYLNGGAGSSQVPGGMGSDMLGGYGIGASMADGIALGLSDGMAANLEGMAASMQTATDKAKEVFDIKSPSGVFYDLGENVVAGFANAVRDGAGLVAQVTADTFGQATQETGKALSDILGAFGTFFKGSKAFAVAQAVINAWLGASEALKLPFPQNLAAFAKVLATGFQAVQSIQSAQPGQGGGGAAAGAAAPVPLQVSLNLQGDYFTAGQVAGSVSGMLDQLVSEANRRGLNLTVRA